MSPYAGFLAHHKNPSGPSGGLLPHTVRRVPCLTTASLHCDLVATHSSLDRISSLPSVSGKLQD